MAGRIRRATTLVGARIRPSSLGVLCDLCARSSPPLLPRLDGSVDSGKRVRLRGQILSYPLLIVLGMLLGSGELSAQISWNSRFLEFRPSVTDTNVEVRFPFKNTGTQTVTISNVTSSCTDCTTMELTKRTYAPNESGEIAAVFRFGERVGVHEKTLTVESDDPKEPKVELKFKVNIPEILKAIPGFVFWLRDGEKIPKVIKLQVVYKEPVHIEWVRSGHPRLQAQLETIRDGWEYALKITPTDTNRPIQGQVRIETDFPVERIRSFYVHAHVK